LSEKKQKLAEELANRMAERINQYAEVMSGWGKAFQLIFTDADVGYWFKVGMDGKLEKLEKAIKSDQAVVTLSWDTETFKGILDKELNAQSAYVGGKIKVDGPTMELLKLQILFG
jgi:putative sterol carrier protein